jgi:transposase
MDCGDLLENLITPSRIFPRDDRELRSLTRTRESLIKVRTKIKIKNKVTHELEAACIKLSSVRAGVFGKSGRHIVEGLLEG